MAKPKWILKQSAHDEVIMDEANQMNFLFLASSGFGTSSDAIRLAKKVVEHLNSLPPEETVLSPFTVDSPARSRPDV